MIHLLDYINATNLLPVQVMFISKRGLSINFIMNTLMMTNCFIWVVAKLRKYWNGRLIKKLLRSLPAYGNSYRQILVVNSPLLLLNWMVLVTKCMWYLEDLSEMLQQLFFAETGNFSIKMIFCNAQSVTISASTVGERPTTDKIAWVVVLISPPYCNGHQDRPIRFCEIIPAVVYFVHNVHVINVIDVICVFAFEIYLHWYTMQCAI